MVCVDVDERCGAGDRRRDHRQVRRRASAWPAAGISELRPRDWPRLRHHRAASRVRAMFGDVVLAYGGLDAVAVTAGIFVPPDKSGRIADDAVGADVCASM